MVMLYETRNYSFYQHKVGCSLTRKNDNRSVYFQPGDCESQALEQVEHCFAVPEMYPSENEKIFDTWSKCYFSA